MRGERHRRADGGLAAWDMRALVATHLVLLADESAQRSFLGLNSTRRSRSLRRKAAVESTALR